MKLQQRNLMIVLAACGLWLAGCITPRRGPQKAVRGAQSAIPFDAIIVPGIPFKGSTWDSVMKARVLWSWILYKNGYARNIIYSGGAVYTPYYESKVMGLYAQELGVPAEHIFYDTLARHSTENVYYSYLLAQQRGFKSLALATDPFQSFMLRGFTRRRFASPVYHIPFVTDSLAVYNYLSPRIEAGTATVPAPASWQSIYEQEGFLRRIQGTMGRDINWRQHRDGRLDKL